MYEFWMLTVIALLIIDKQAILTSTFFCSHLEEKDFQTGHTELSAF